MRTIRRPAPALVALLASLCLAVAGCSGDGSDEPSGVEALLAAAPTKTIEAGSARIAVDASIQGQRRGTFAGEGAFAFETERGRLQLDLGPLGLAGASDTEVLLDADVVYLKLGGALPGLGQRPWVRIDLGALKPGQGDGIEALRQLRANDPRAVINELRGASGDAAEVGKEAVRGTDTTHYRTTVDLDDAASASPPSVRDDLAEVARQLGTSKLAMEAWLDAEGRIRRLQYTIDLADLDDDAPAKRTGTGMVVARLELYEFGVEVAVEPPPEDQTTDLAELLGTGN
jgi:hypothetical protein